MIKVIVGIPLFIGAVLSVPLGGFTILPALRKREPAWNNAGTAQDLPIDTPVERRFFEMIKKGLREQKVERAAWFVKKPDGTVVAFSPSCPHLGCGYRWIVEKKEFHCPCHASVFDINGTVLAGPAPRALDRLQTKVEEGSVFVRFEVFQLGIPGRVQALLRRNHDHPSA
jgi:menaquinol-cytochrome c reductase iron-sulfur subunit